MPNSIADPTTESDVSCMDRFSSPNFGARGQTWGQVFILEFVALQPDACFRDIHPGPISKTQPTVIHVNSRMLLSSRASEPQ